jgi:hypothetical protein
VRDRVKKSVDGKDVSNAPELIIKGKRISCPPQYGHRDLQAVPRRLGERHDFEHGFPLIRSLRAPAQRSTSVLFSFLLSLLIVAGSFTIRQSKTILARCCEASWGLVAIGNKRQRRIIYVA